MHAGRSHGRRILTSPVQITVGGRSVVNKDIHQIVEIRPEEDRLMRLLGVLGEWYDRGKVLVFVSTHEKCDNMFRDLLRLGYPCLSLHGGKEQADRQCTIEVPSAPPATHPSCMTRIRGDLIRDRSSA